MIKSENKGYLSNIIINFIQILPSFYWTVSLIPNESLHLYPAFSYQYSFNLFIWNKSSVLYV